MKPINPLADSASLFPQVRRTSSDVVVDPAPTFVTYVLPAGAIITSSYVSACPKTVPRDEVFEGALRVLLAVLQS